MNKIKSILKIEADVLTIFAIFMIIPYILALVLNEKAASQGLLTAILLCAILSAIILITCKKTDYDFKYRDGFLIVTIVWTSISLIGSLPFLVSGAIPNFLSALFESTSGLTTTGASILNYDDYSSFPLSLMLYRSLIEWIGGMGILLLLSVMLPSWGVNAQTLAFTEATGPSNSKLSAKFSDSAKKLYMVYIVITVLAIFSLKIFGMTWYDAVIHAFSTVSTGGFSNHQEGISYYSGTFIPIVIIVFMLLASINFNLLYLGKRKRLGRIFKDEESRFYIGIILIATILISIMNYRYMNGTPGLIIKDSLFNVVSVISTTGFSLSDFGYWPTFSQAIILMLYFIGGCASSTAGGVKSVRILIAGKLIKRSFSMRLHSNRVSDITLNKKEVPHDTIIKVTTFLLTYILVAFSGALVLSINGFDLMTNFSASLSALGNVGPGFSKVSASQNFALYSGFSKLVLSLLMIIGRLEILSAFMLFSRNYWNTNQVK